MVLLSGSQFLAVKDENTESLSPGFGLASSTNQVLLINLSRKIVQQKYTWNFKVIRKEMDEFVHNITDQQITILKDHLELVLEQIRTTNKQTSEGNEKSLNVNYEINGEGYNGILQENSFWSVQKLYALSFQLLEKVRMMIADREQQDNQKAELQSENQALKKRVSQLKQSLERINDFQDQNLYLFESGENDKENNPSILSESINSFNLAQQKQKENFIAEKEDLKKAVSLQEKELKYLKERIRDLDTENYCLNYQLKILQSDFDKEKLSNSTLAHDLSLKNKDYDYLLQKIESITQELNFYRLPDHLEDESQSDKRNYERSFFVPKISGMKENDDWSQRNPHNISFRSGSECLTDRNNYEKVILSQQIVDYQEVQLVYDRDSWKCEKSHSNLGPENVESFSLKHRSKDEIQTSIVEPKVSVDRQVNTENEPFAHTETHNCQIQTETILEAQKEIIKIAKENSWYQTVPNLMKNFVHKRLQPTKSTLEREKHYLNH